MNGADFLADTNAVLYLLAGNACMAPYLSSILNSSIENSINVRRV